MKQQLNQFKAMTPGPMDSETVNNVTPPLSRAFGASTEAFNQAAGSKLDETRVTVDKLTSMTQSDHLCGQTGAATAGDAGQPA